MGIGIAEKSHKTRRDRWGGNVRKSQIPILTLSQIFSYMLYNFEASQNRDLWFTLPPQRSLLVLWLFSAIPSCFVAFFSDPYSHLKFPIFYSSSLCTFY